MDETKEQEEATPEKTMDERNEQHDSLQKKNITKLQLLQASNVNIDPGSIAAARLNFFIAWLLGEGTPNRLDFEIDWETKLAELLNALDGEARKAILLDGIKNGKSPAEARSNGN